MRPINHRERPLFIVIDDLKINRSNSPRDLLVAHKTVFPVRKLLVGPFYVVGRIRRPVIKRHEVPIVPDRNRLNILICRIIKKPITGLNHLVQLAIRKGRELLIGAELVTLAHCDDADIRHLGPIFRSRLVRKLARFKRKARHLALIIKHRTRLVADLKDLVIRVVIFKISTVLLIIHRHRVRHRIFLSGRTGLGLTRKRILASQKRSGKLRGLTLRDIADKRIRLILIGADAAQRILVRLPLKILLLLTQILHVVDLIGFIQISSESGGRNARKYSVGKTELDIALRHQKGEDHKQANRLDLPRFSFVVIRAKHSHVPFLTTHLKSKNI